jgi:hypothetical protein
MDWQNVLGVAATIFALASAAGLGLMRGTLTTLRSSNDDLRNRVSDLEKDRVEKTAELAEVRSENRTLKAMVTGRVEWTAISDQLEEHHRQSLGAWKRMDANLTKIHRDLNPKGP